jgi:hypothetical protein
LNGEDISSEKEVAYPSYLRISGLKNNLPSLSTSQPFAVPQDSD